MHNSSPLRDHLQLFSHSLRAQQIQNDLDGIPACTEQAKTLLHKETNIVRIEKLKLQDLN